MQLNELVEYLNSYLRVAEIPDAPQALNGLQVENGGQVRRVAVAVDGSEAAVQEAARRGCDLLILHHGLFWDGNRPVAGRRYRRLRTLFAADMAVYSAHIPLDVHPEVGNNAVIARELGVDVAGWFGDYQGVQLGVWGTLDTARDDLHARLRDLLRAEVKLIAGGPERIRRLGVLSGAGGSYIGEALALGLDAFITGEGAHHTYFDAMEGGLNVYYGGHYATETWGVRALAAHLESRFGLPWEFLDLPTGM